MFISKRTLEARKYRLRAKEKSYFHALETLASNLPSKLNRNIIIHLKESKTFYDGKAIKEINKTIQIFEENS